MSVKGATGDTRRRCAARIPAAVEEGGVGVGVGVGWCGQPEVIGKTFIDVYRE